jgi:hypothetical protein
MLGCSQQLARVVLALGMKALRWEEEEGEFKWDFKENWGHSNPMLLYSTFVLG